MLDICLTYHTFSYYVVIIFIIYIIHTYTVHTHKHRRTVTSLFCCHLPLQLRVVYYRISSHTHTHGTPGRAYYYVILLYVFFFTFLSQHTYRCYIAPYSRRYLSSRINPLASARQTTVVQQDRRTQFTPRKYAPIYI